MLRRFAPPWTIEDIGDAFKMRDAKGQALAFVHCRDVSGMSHGLLNKGDAGRSQKILPSSKAPKEMIQGGASAHLRKPSR